MQSKPHANAKDLARKFPLHTKLAQIRFTIRANAQTIMASKRCLTAAINPQLIGFHLALADMQIAPSKADDMQSTAKSLPTQVATMEIRYKETAVRRKPLVKAVREFDCSTGAF
ncbi:hypothetical protein ES332_A02G046700v1 [Gossypium tomentosum]|uniref:Uncharacterized protein n=1 Tax=Gossypium tomentosum TaxID=34277 RepID=A0A5D2RFP8_GOSTO|nr:hypothetical protein ES332_A02G046700v1 [Gossypium tomentosum]